MVRNVGAVDRVIRVVIGLVLISQVFWGLQTPWGWLGLIPLISGIVAICPVYRLLGLSTCPVERRPG